MDTYTVKYKMHGAWFWTTIKNVVGDDLAENWPFPTRVFIKKTEERIEVPMGGTQFKFAKERTISILKNQKEVVEKNKC